MNQLVKKEENILVTGQFTREQIELIKRTYCVGATDDELALFIQVCQRTGLDPMARQIYAVKRFSGGREVMTTQISIDGMRLIAQRGGKYLGPTETYWYTKKDGWKDLWLPEKEGDYPLAAKAGCRHADFIEPMWAVARFDAYAQRKKDGGLTAMWAKMPDVMIAKCAESLVLRKAFPQELSGLYSAEEMGQSLNPQPLPSQPSMMPVRKSELTEQPAKIVITTTYDMPPDESPPFDPFFDAPQQNNEIGTFNADEEKTDQRLISEAQQKRLFAISKAAGIKNEEMKVILKADFGFDSSQQITRDVYPVICDKIEKMGQKNA